MAVIRPLNPSHIQTPAQAPKARSTAEAKAAQRAFFQQAMGDVTPLRAAPTGSASAQVQSRNIQRPIPDAPPEHNLRPGSFVDIKV